MPHGGPEEEENGATRAGMESQKSWKEERSGPLSCLVLSGRRCPPALSLLLLRLSALSCRCLHVCVCPMRYAGQNLTAIAYIPK